MVQMKVFDRKYKSIHMSYGPFLFLTVRVLLTGDINNSSEYIQSEFYLEEAVEHEIEEQVWI